MTEGATNNWTDIVNNNALSQHLPKTTPIPNEEEEVAVPVPSPPRKKPKSTPTPVQPCGAGIELRPNEEVSQGELFKEAWGSLSKHPKAPPAAGKSSGKRKPPPRKKKKDKAAPSRDVRKAWGSIAKPSRDGKKAWGSLAKASTSSGRRLQVSREALEADGTSLGLFTRKDSLSTTQLKFI